MQAALTSEFVLTVKRNCSLSPKALMLMLGGGAAVPLLAGAAFAVQGAWLILPFAGLELLLLAAAFRSQARHACDREPIACSAGRLAVEVTEGGRERRWEFDAARVRMERREAAAHCGIGRRLVLRSGGCEVEIGRHFDALRGANGWRTSSPTGLGW